MHSFLSDSIDLSYAEIHPCFILYQKQIPCCLQIVVYLVGSYNLLNYHVLIDVKLVC